MKAKLKDGRELVEIGQAIIAAWYRVLPENDGEPIGDIDADELTALFNQILETPCRAIVDPKGGPINISVPQPPEEVKSRDSLVEYLTDWIIDDEKNPTHAQYEDVIASAVIFGCGK